MTDSNNNEEVKEFTQTVQVGPSQGDDETVEEGEEETETPPSSSDGENEPEADDTTEEDETPEEEEEEAPVADDPAPEPKPVDGETPRERALRLELTRVKGIVRDQKREELFVKKPAPLKKDDEALEGYDPDEIKRLELIVGKLGYVKKDEIVSQTISERLNDTFNEFMDAHPEYAPENDKDGLIWNQFRSEFALYNPSNDPKTLKKILAKVHNDVFGVQPAKNLTKINASQEKIKVASHSGASAGKESKTKTPGPSGLRLDALKGFSEEEKEEIFGRN